MYTFLAKIEYHNIVTEKGEKECVIITNASTFEEASKRLEEVYGDDLLNFSIELFDSPIAIMPEELYDTLREGLNVR
jgi:hypothetical protein